MLTGGPLSGFSGAALDTATSVLADESAEDNEDRALETAAEPESDGTPEGLAAGAEIGSAGRDGRCRKFSVPLFGRGVR